MSYKAILKSIESCLCAMPNKIDWKGFRHKVFFRAFFWKQDDRLCQMSFNLIQEKLRETMTLDPDLREYAVATWLCYIPYTRPKAGQVLQVPIKNELITYQVSWVPMSNYLWRWHRYDILLLEGGPTWVIFMGTTYPACQGFWTTVMSDLFPYDIGWLFSSSKNLHKRLKGLDTCYAAGMSLGAQFMHFTTNHISVKKRFFIKPALPFKPTVPKKGDVWIINEKDPVSRLGRLHPKSQVLLVKHRDDSGSQGLLAHLQPKIVHQDALVERAKATELRPFYCQRLLYYGIRPIGFFLLLPFYLGSLLMAALVEVMQQE